MKILCLADEESRSYWDYFKKEKLADIDLIISCGDLRSEYLTFLVTMGHAPLLYVHGNHDEGYATRPPEGCDCIDDQVVEFRGLRIAGLGGCLRYRPGKFQYTEDMMQKRIRRMSRKLKKGVDIVVAHAPIRGIGDMEDLPHRGFAVFRPLLETYEPMFFLHGHIHACYGHGQRQEYAYSGTRIINVEPTYVLEIPDDAIPDRSARPRRLLPPPGDRKK